MQVKIIDLHRLSLHVIKARMAKDRNVRAMSLRLPEDLHVQVEQFRDKMAKELPGSEPSVADAARVLIRRGLRSAK